MNKYDRIQAQNEVDKNKDALSKLEAEKAYNKLSDAEKAKYKTVEDYYNQNKDYFYYVAVDEQLKTNRENNKNLGGMGSDVSKGIDSAISIVTGIITGNITGGLAGASAPWVAEQIKIQTGDNETARLISHAILGAVVAELQGNSGLAGGAGAVTGELAADIIREQLYGKKAKDLTEAEKENISALAQLATGLAVASVGGDVGDVSTGIAAGKNAVENNLLSPNETSQLQYWKAQLQKAKTDEDRKLIQANIDYINYIDKTTDEYVQDVCKQLTSEACQSAHKILGEIKEQYDSPYSGYPISNPLLVKELFYNQEAAAKVDAAYANSEASTWMYSIEALMKKRNISFEEAYEELKPLMTIEAVAEIASHAIITKAAVKTGYSRVGTGKVSATKNRTKAEELLNNNSAGKGTTSTGLAGNAASELPALPPGKQGTVIKNALEPHEYQQALDIVKYKGGTFKGAEKANNPGIDGWLDGVPVQLKEVQGKSIHAVRRNITDGAKDMAKQGYKGDLYIDASKTGVSMNEMINHFKPGSPVSNITKEGTVNNIYIKTQDGWLNVTGGSITKGGNK